MAPTIDLRPDHRKIVEDLLREHLPQGVKVWVFGSRAEWTTKDSSDLDLALEGDGPLDRRIVMALELAFEESLLPFSVDVVDLFAVTDTFRNRVVANRVLLRLPSNASDDLPSEYCRSHPGGRSIADCAMLVRNSVHPEDMFDQPYVGLEHIAQGSLQLIGHGSSRDVTSVKSSFRRGDILFGKLRPYFRKAVRAPFNGICSTDIWVIRAKAGSVQDYLFYLMANPSFIKFATRTSEGTRMPRANWSAVSRYQVNLPPVPEQRTVARVLGALDDRIALNRRMNETLEAMTQALFKSWFVNFDPVRAKMEGRDTGLPPEIADLFPDRFVRSELGETPKGWNNGCLEEIVHSPRRIVDPRALEGQTPYIGLEHMPRRSVALSESSRATNVTSAKYSFKKDEVLFGRLRPYFHKVGIASFSGICSTDILVLAPKKPMWIPFVLACVSSDDFVGYSNRTSTGTKMPRSSWKVMRTYPLCLPPEDVVSAFRRIVGPWIDSLMGNVSACLTNRSVRDALIPKLVSGDLRVSVMDGKSNECPSEDLENAGH